MNLPSKIRNTNIFHNISEECIEKMLSCMQAKFEMYEKNNFIIPNGGGKKKLGIVLEGNALLIREDFHGDRVVLSRVSEGEIFRISYVDNAEALGISVLAGSMCYVLFLNTDRVFTPCKEACGCHNKMLYNIIVSLSEKNISLVRKIQHISKLTLRGKIKSFLLEQAEICGKTEFIIPYNRQEMADYLAADRSALSAELGRMQREGLIEYKKNRFILKGKLYGN